MLRHNRVLVPVLTLMLGVPAFAGGAECAKGASLAKNEKAAGVEKVAAHEKCSKSAEECKKYFSEAKTRGWAGLELDKNEKDGTLTVIAVNPVSPAAKAGFLKGDVLVALNGVALTDDNHDKLAQVKSTLKPGSEVMYKVKRNGADRYLTVALGTMPDSVLDEMVARHMREHQDAEPVATR
jgi:C-terminal processing protease CtpA/Prc